MPMSRRLAMILKLPTRFYAPLPLISVAQLTTARLETPAYVPASSAKNYRLFQNLAVSGVLNRDQEYVTHLRCRLPSTFSSVPLDSGNRL